MSSNAKQVKNIISVHVGSVDAKNVISEHAGRGDAKNVISGHVWSDGTKVEE